MLFQPLGRLNRPQMVNLAVNDFRAKIKFSRQFLFLLTSPFSLLSIPFFLESLYSVPYKLLTALVSKRPYASVTPFHRTGRQPSVRTSASKKILDSGNIF